MLQKLTPIRVWAATWLVALLLVAAVAVAAAVEDPADIASAAQAEALRIAAVAGGNVRATVNGVDERLRLVKCAEPLRARPAQAGQGQARLTIEVSCPQPAWRLFVPVALETTLPVVVAVRPLPARTLLTPADLQVAERDLVGLPQGYFQRPDDLAGRELLRPLATGEAVSAAVLRVNPAIRRGQQVTLVAKAGGLTVRVRGEALTDAGITQRIRVRNLSSGRTIEGTVRSADVVDVAL